MVDFNRWRSETDATLKRDYVIDLADAGADEERLIEAWREGESPAEYVERFALKYDLDRAPTGSHP